MANQNRQLAKTNFPDPTLIVLIVIKFWSIFDVTLTLKLQGQIWNLLYRIQNGVNATKRKAQISIEI